MHYYVAKYVHLFTKEDFSPFVSSLFSALFGFGQISYSCIFFLFKLSHHLALDHGTSGLLQPIEPCLILYLDINVVDLLFDYTKMDHYVWAILCNVTIYLPKTILNFYAEDHSTQEKYLSLLLLSFATMTDFIILLPRIFFAFTVTLFQLHTFAWVLRKHILILLSAISWNLSRTLSVIFTFILFALVSVWHVSFSPAFFSKHLHLLFSLKAPDK